MLSIFIVMLISVIVFATPSGVFCMVEPDVVW